MNFDSEVFESNELFIEGNILKKTCNNIFIEFEDLFEEIMLTNENEKVIFVNKYEDGVKDSTESQTPTLKKDNQNQDLNTEGELENSSNNCTKIKNIIKDLE